MLRPRLRLYTKNITYFRMLQGLFGLRSWGDVENTECVIAQYTKAHHAILTSMGRMAIYDGLRALGTKGEIILSPITVPEVISLVHAAGFTPVFCDVASGTWNMDAEQIESLITAQTVAVMTTHFYGNTNTTMAVRAICDKHDLYMIEDAAQALGAYCGGKHAGTVGDIGILSFSYPKNVTSFYGGCAITNDDAIAMRIRQAVAAYPAIQPGWLNRKAFACAIKDIGTWGPLFQLSSFIIRYGYRHKIHAIINTVSQSLLPAFLDDIPEAYRTQISAHQARAIHDKWPEINEDALHRILCAEIYHRVLDGLPGLIQAELATDRSHTYLYYPVQVADKYALQDYMIERKCDVAVQHAPNCADLELYRRYYRDCPNARAAYAGTVMLPTYRGFPLREAERYAHTIKRFLTS